MTSYRLIEALSRTKTSSTCENLIVKENRLNQLFDSKGFSSRNCWLTWQKKCTLFLTVFLKISSRSASLKVSLWKCPDPSEIYANVKKVSSPPFLLLSPECSAASIVCAPLLRRRSGGLEQRCSCSQRLELMPLRSATLLHHINGHLGGCWRRNVRHPRRPFWRQVPHEGVSPHSPPAPLFLMVWLKLCRRRITARK